MKKFINKLVIAVLIVGICGGAYAVLRPLGIAQRGSTAFGGEILFITVMPFVLYLIGRCIHDSVYDFRKLVKKDDADGKADRSGKELLSGYLRDGKDLQTTARRSF